MLVTKPKSTGKPFFRNLTEEDGTIASKGEVSSQVRMTTAQVAGTPIQNLWRFSYTSAAKKWASFDTSASSKCRENSDSAN
jgi:hypothetical protein